MPFYPPLARQARVQGVVNLRIVVAQDGTVTIDSASGHPLLRDTTAEYVKTWKFGWQQPCACTVKRDVSFVYKISDSKAESDSPIAIVKWFGSSKVEVETNLPVEAILTN